MLQIKLFGSGQAAYFGRSLEAFPTQQPHQLLCYLLINARYPVLRDRLATIFWADYPSSVALKNLRNTLWKLRQVFGRVDADLEAYLLVSDSSVAVRRTSPYWLDVEVFEAAVESCRAVPGHALDADQAALLAEAAEIYTGDLLEGCYGEWCLYERERLSLLHLSALAKLVGYFEGQRNWSQGLHYGNLILERDNTRERVHRQMMRLYWQAGDRDAALAQYKRCCEIMRDELGVSPMRETTQVYQQMAHNQYSQALKSENKQLPVPSHARLERLKMEDSPDGSLQVLAEKTLQRVHYLQSMLEDTRAELRYLESLINQELINADVVK